MNITVMMQLGLHVGQWLSTWVATPRGVVNQFWRGRE